MFHHAMSQYDYNTQTIALFWLQKQYYCAWEHTKSGKCSICTHSPFYLLFCSQQIQPWKKKSCCRQNKEKIPDSFLLFNGLKVHFFTGRTSNNYSSLQQVWALIYQHLKGGAVVQSKERKERGRKRWAKWGQDVAARNGRFKKTGDRSREHKSRFSISRNRQSFHAITENVLLKFEKRKNVRWWEERHC